MNQSITTLEELRATKREMPKEAFCSMYGISTDDVQSDTVLVYAEGYFIERHGRMFRVEFMNKYYESTDLTKLEEKFWNEFLKLELS